MIMQEAFPGIKRLLKPVRFKEAALALTIRCIIHHEPWAMM